MFRHILPISVFLFAGVLIPGCPESAPQKEIGGLELADFKQININGFDQNDNALDKNDYAWAMDYFQGDGQDRGYIYVGTGNDMIGLIYQGISAVMGMNELGDVAARPPEIRRYRDDRGKTDWERVFDYRDVESDPDFETIGFRHMKTYRAAANGVNYLYAATMGREATVWRTASGDPGDWEMAWASGQIGSVRMMAEHNGVLYLGLANEIPEGERLGKIYATDGEQIWPIMENGFGNPDNIGVSSLISYNGWLYVGTLNEVTGCEVWKLEGPDGEVTPVKLVSNGGPSPANQSAITMCVYHNQLYIGTMLNPMANITAGLKAADIFRIDENDHWETIIGSGSVIDVRSGFNHWPNTYIWSMAEHEGWLYVGTYDQVSPFFNVIENMDKVFNAFFGRNAREANFWEVIWHAGADLYKTNDGETFHLVTSYGFEDVGNYGIRTLVSVGDTLYVGTANPFDGLEIWRGRDTHE